MEENNFHIGQKVKLVTNKGVEVGVIVWIWEDGDLGFLDAYVAMFGSAFPQHQPTDKPGIYRYALASLRPYEET